MTADIYVRLHALCALLHLCSAPVNLQPLPKAYVVPQHATRAQHLHRLQDDRIVQVGRALTQSRPVLVRTHLPVKIRRPIVASIGSNLSQPVAPVGPISSSLSLSLSLTASRSLHSATNTSPSLAPETMNAANGLAPTNSLVGPMLTDLYQITMYVAHESIYVAMYV